ncbi:MAG: 1-deoxy-D-xylulose-5-phosphate reductoisomerase [Defluviitaleaceae bacterium]|nr:1-deoxy-D-xylulose-5-phosphate reductoisomerase [Defluviitaleaceae bacterium]
MNLVVMGSTGSIGTQTLDVLRGLQTNRYNVVALTAHSNVDLMEQQVREFSPKLAVMYDENAALELKKRIGDICEISHGMDGLEEAACNRASLVVNALVGGIGLLPTIAAIKAGNNIALANKETLVCAGEIIMPLTRKHGVEILPLDSEHSAIFQCLAGSETPPLRLILTASGGPFRGKNLHEMQDFTVEQALSHPNWSMGKKISIDSATMMNKGLEVIEARWLFDMPTEKIDVLVHPQSVIHSMVEFCDGQVLAQLGAPDMRNVIQYALTHPRRLPNNFGKLDFNKHFSLDFSPPDVINFPCLHLAYEALHLGGLYPAVLNAANEVAVAMFLERKIRFTDIAGIIERTMSAYNGFDRLIDIDAVLEVQKWATTHIKEAAN